MGASETTLRVLEALKELDGAGVTELANELGLPKSTVHSHLATLREHEYVCKDGDTYSVGLRFLEFGEYIRAQKKIHEVARPEVENLADETGELANLAVEEHGRAVYLYRAKGKQAVNLDTFPGMRVPLHCTALGKVILANLPDERVEEVVNRHGLPERTPNTITDEQTLREELAAIRERGYAFDDEERLLGLRCVAAPVARNEDDVVGAVSVSGPTSRVKGERFTDEIPELLLNAANVIEINMTYS